MLPLVAFLFAFVLLMVILGGVLEPIAPIHLSLLYLLLFVITFNQYNYRKHGGISPLLSLQIALTFALGTALITLVVGGLGLRRLELAIVFVLLLAFVLAHDDLRRFLPTTVPYIAAFGVIVGIFFYHGQEFPSASGLGLFPVLAGIILGFNLFVVPRYVSEDAVYWAITGLAGLIAMISLPVVVYGDFTLWGFELRTWGEMSVVFTDREVTTIRSIFANPNTFALVMFPGVVVSAIATHRLFTRSSYPFLALVTTACFTVTSLGLYLSNSRASLFAAAIALVIYAGYVVGNRRIVPWVLLVTVIAASAFLVAIYLGVLPIDPGNRFTLWRAGLEAVRNDAGLVGQGIVGTGGVIEPYHDLGGYAVHNSYLSVAIRAGLLGGLAYVVLVIGPVVHGVVRFDRVNVGMLALATGFAVHQLFEGYTLYQFGPGSVIGALAVGYVIHSFVPDDRSAETTTETDEQSEAETDGNATDA